MLTCPQLKIPENQDIDVIQEKTNNITIFMKTAKVPLRFLSASFQNTQNNICDSVKKFSENGNGICVITGGNGTGKTRTAACAIRNRIDNGLTAGKFISCKYEVCPLIRSSRSFKAEHSEQQILESFYKTPFLVIDEAGRGDDQTISKSFLVNVLSARYDNELPTLITTNFLIQDLCNFLGQDVTSRFFETAEVLNLSGDDRRKTNE